MKLTKIWLHALTAATLVGTTHMAEAKHKAHGEKQPWPFPFPFPKIPWPF